MRIYKAIVFLFGLFSILEIFKYNIGPFHVYPGDIFFFLFTIFSLVYASSKKDNKYKLYYCGTKSLLVIFVLLIVVTCNFYIPIIDYTIFPTSLDGTQMSILYSIKTSFTILVFFIILNCGYEVQNIAVRYYVIGFFSAIVLNALYSWLQMGYWYFLSEDIHTQFCNFLGVTEQTVGHVLVNYVFYPIIRVSGLHWDPAYFGLWGSIATLTLICSNTIKYKALLLMIIAIPWIMTFSRTGFFSFGVCLIGVLLLKRYLNVNFSIQKILIFFSAFVILIISISMFLTEDLRLIICDSFEEKFITNVNNTDAGTARHFNYPLYSIEALCNDPLHFIFGYGARNSSRGIYMTGNIPEFVGSAVFDIESDFCKMIVNYGIIGIVLYILFNFLIIRAYVYNIKSISDSFLGYLFLVAIASILFGGIFYVYNDSKWVWFIYFFAIIYLNNSFATELNTNVFEFKGSVSEQDAKM